MYLKLLKMKWKTPGQRINYPIIGLMAATALLLIIVSLMTYMNYDRETQLLKDHLKRQGLTLIRALEAGARSGMMEMMWSENQIQTLLTETAKGPNIQRILLVNENRQIVTDSSPDSGSWYPKQFIKPTDTNQTVTLIFEPLPDRNIFRIIQRFLPLNREQRSQGSWFSGR